MSTSTTQFFGIHETVDSLRKTLRSYVEAQYHIWNESLIRERELLLEQTGTLWQEPYMESTPVYSSGDPYRDLNIDENSKSILSEFAAAKLLPEKPYKHQARALEAFLTEGNDLVIATGTGSGKTECFLMPILCQLCNERVERPDSANTPAMRALLLYPMNALVNDQLSRIRRLLGSPQAQQITQYGVQRPIRFGSYTGRTPYPGARSATKDGQNLGPLFDNFYIPLLENEELLDELNRIGRLPAKDLRGFYAAHREREAVYASGKKKGKSYTKRNWDKRLITMPDDSELLTRHEMHRSTPDILITNYSMLEYMLMRPIERSIFEDTARWLQENEKNSITLVLDEAHMYRGAGGAEVALLIRRLTSRLGIGRNRVRAILTSASLGSDENSVALGKRFAIDLTGGNESSSPSIEIIRGEPEARDIDRELSSSDVEALAEFDISAFQKFNSEFPDARDAFLTLAEALRIDVDVPQNVGELRNQVYLAIEHLEPTARLIEAISGKAVPLTSIDMHVFGESSAKTGKATASLLALATSAMRATDERVLLPARAHLFFRGLPGLFACIDHSCDVRLDRSSTDPLLGRLYAQPKTVCGCTNRARVFELLTHRDCGAAFLKGYMNGMHGDFLWQEASWKHRETSVDRLIEVQVLVEREPIGELHNNCQEAWIDVQSGRILRTAPDDPGHFLRAWLPDESSYLPEKRQLLFRRCPVCGRRWRESRSKIMDHETKGEAPFAALVKSQLIGQPASRREDENHPNGGRKVLLFSDGRQKAARLARDIPREVEDDIFRQILTVAYRKLQGARGSTVTPTRELYASVVSVVADFNLPLFDRSDAATLRRHVRTYKEAFSYDGESGALEEIKESSPPPRYYRALLKQLCGRYYSIKDSTVGFVTANRRSLRRINSELNREDIDLDDNTLLEVSTAYVSEMLSSYSFDSDLDDSVRAAAASYWTGDWSHKGELAKCIVDTLITGGILEPRHVESLTRILKKTLTEGQSDSERFLRPTALNIVLDLEHEWYRCKTCGDLSPIPVSSTCSSCGSTELVRLNPADSEYIRARKGYWRNPVQEVIQSTDRMKSISVEEHSAQLSNRDKTQVYATTELYELRFQDIPIEEGSLPIDVLSCTTTMEVGVDIGSLLAVGLRNVPPERQNYQQRAGRAGRRGSAVSTVLTYAQNGPHDSHYFHHPSEIVSGEPRTPELKVDNPKIAQRHVHSFLLQTFFQESLDEESNLIAKQISRLEECLGLTEHFLLGNGPDGFDLDHFSNWVLRNYRDAEADGCQAVAQWLPQNLSLQGRHLAEWVASVASSFVSRLFELKEAYVGSGDQQLENEIDVDDERNEKEKFLEFLFFHGLLPSYAFPTDLTSFLVEKFTSSGRGGRREVITVERPQQALSKALSEYAPGRLVVINKETYRSGGVVADVLPTVEDRAKLLFDRSSNVTHCSSCSFVADPDGSRSVSFSHCPICRSELRSDLTLTPEVFLPLNRRPLMEGDRDQDFTYATMAQFPVPSGEVLDKDFRKISNNCSVLYKLDRRLVTLNKGQKVADEFTGFWICNKCGSASVDEPAHGQHDRPYFIQPTRGSSDVSRTCGGEFANVFLGHSFLTDLLLIRIEVSDPIISDTTNSLVLRTLEDALYSIAEALRLSASRHRQLDLDPGEFGSGFRIVPVSGTSNRYLDLYLYDTLSGGAGYSEIAHKYIEEILSDTVSTLEDCPSNCVGSCQDCLRHFHNQHVQGRLDRKLGADLLKYALHGTVPRFTGPEDESQQLLGLKRLLELDGMDCASAVEIDGTTVPLSANRNGITAAIGLRHGLLSEESTQHSVQDFHMSLEPIRPVVLNHYLVQKSLPDAHQKVRQEIS